MANHIVNDASERGRGRPRLLSTDQVLEAAVELGLEGLTMTALAKRLGVSLGMIYGYVSNREELIELASARASQDYGYPDDVGQHWTVYAAENALAWFKFFTGPGEFLKRYLAGKTGFAPIIDHIAIWITVMQKWGFEPASALTLQRRMGEIVMGGALVEMRNQSLPDIGQHLSSALAARGTDEGDEGLRIYAETAQGPVWPINLVELLRSTAQERGETYDPQPVDRVIVGVCRRS